ncbi:MAG: amidohydrolase [Chloroflexi bacterium]|nr:amidohydrolase [Chloroflexota bacterium]
MPRPPADTVLTNARIITMDPTQPQAEAVAIKDGLVLGVGSADDVRGLADPAARVHDLQGRSLVPGFHDSHNHMLATAQSRALVDLSQAHTVADVIDRLRQRAARTPHGEWVLTSGRWHETQLDEKRFPQRQELDMALPDHPVMIQRGGHNIVVNSRAFQLAGVAEDVPNPSGGTFVRDPNTGRLSGHVIDAAMHPLREQVPPPTQQQLESALLAMQARYNAAGLTSVLEPGLHPREMAVWRALRDRGELSIRGTLMWRLHPGFDATSLQSTLDAINRGEVTIDADDAWVRTTAIKLGIDGGVEAGFYREPFEHPDDADHPRGLPLVSPENFRAVCELAAQQGWQLGTHCVGDAGIDNVLDGYEAANNVAPIRGLRWTLIHMMYAREDHWPRANRLGVIVTAQQPLQYTLADGFRHYIGAERTRDIEPLRMYLDRSEQPVGGGSDSPVTPYQPLIGIWSSVTRATDRAGVQGPEWAVSVDEALRMYTSGSAWSAFEENIKGSITPGKLADLVVLDKDPRSVAPDELRELQVERTYVGGKLVYARDEARV